MTDAVNPAADDEEYDYDALGNRIRSAAVGGVWNYNLNNELEDYGSTTLTHDNNGNITIKRVGTDDTTYVYDEGDRMVEVLDDNSNPIAVYYYDPFGRRLWKNDGNGGRTYYLYSDEGLIGEYDSNGLEIKTYGYAIGSQWGTNPLYQKVGADYYWYHNDHQGTPQKITKTDGEVVWSATYDSFGKTTVSDTSTITNNLRFAGQYFDAETGLHYNWNRYYDPETGRYMRVDPVGEGLNLYLYVQNNPLKYIDPRGLTTRSYQNTTSSYTPNVSLTSGNQEVPGLASAPEWNGGGGQSGGILSRLGNAVRSTVSGVADFTSNAVSAVAGVASSVAKTVTSPHFEGRASRNVNLPTYEGVTSKESQWDLRSPAQSVFHDNGDDFPELKYTNPDGREVVFDGKTHEIVTDPRYIGTYNYVVPAPFPDKWWDVGGLAKWAVKGGGHIVADVAPYALGGGNVRGKY